MFGRGGVDTNKVGLDLAPVIDGYFLPKPIAELRKETPVKSCMVGACQHESLVFAALLPSAFTARGMDKLLRTYIPEDKYPNCEQLRDKAREYYLNDVDTANKLSVAKAYDKKSAQIIRTAAFVAFLYLTNPSPSKFIDGSSSRLGSDKTQ
ncbi:unnamed protein product [Gongylonema pulchrum]|uniref:COesterase domain-containing protein n=1 Tax=Gongylonema pulchrum TaxID=637853 RepID=A0A183E6U2_9BILA|nr:unnamed protein product [Gongylonema pulchrum]